MNIADFHNAESGPVALLGNGPSLAEWDLPALAERMPLFGMNTSWKLIETRWRCYVDVAHHDDIRLGRAPAPEVAFFLEDHCRKAKPEPLGPALTRVGVSISSRPRPSGEHGFCGAALGGGSFGLFAGYLALEIAQWMGFNPIHLIGYDGEGGHFDEPDVERSTKETESWRQDFRVARACLDRAGVRVINCSPASVIDAFEFAVDTEIERCKLTGKLKSKSFRGVRM